MYISFYSCLFLEVLAGSLLFCLIYWMRIGTNIAIFLSKFALNKSKQLGANKRFRGRPNNWWCLSFNLGGWYRFLGKIFVTTILKILDGGEKIFWDGSGNCILRWYFISGGLLNFLSGGTEGWVVEVMLGVHYYFGAIIFIWIFIYFK